MRVTRIVTLRASMLLATLSGCWGGEQYGGELAAIRVRGHVVGVEHRVVDGRTLRVERELLGRRSTLTVELDPDGRLVGYSEQGGRAWTAAGEGPWLLETAPDWLVAMRTGEQQQRTVFDPVRFEPVLATVARDGELVRWSGPTGGGELRLDGDRVLSSRVGVLEIAVVQDRPPIEVVDLSELLAIPVAALADARASRRMVAEVRGVEVPSGPLQRVDGAEVTVEVPLAAEVSRADRDRLARLVAAVADAGDCEARSHRLVALARQESLEARVVVGLVYLDDPRPAFRPHAWVEVTLASGVVPVDPSLGSSVADAARIALVEDRPDAPRLFLQALDGIAIEPRELR